MALRMAPGSGRLRSMKFIRKFLFTALAAVIVLPATAHHSGAMFDDQKSITLTGTVKQYQWTNPHCWIQVLVPDSKGATEWSVEMGAPMELFRNGWRPGTLRAGDKITVVIHPMRDGSHGGLYVSAVSGDGKPFGKPRSTEVKAVL
jgi:hypothetical protein